MYYNMFLYIDPATGGMLFTILFGLISAAVYFVRSIAVKLKYSVGLDRNIKGNSDKLPIVIFSDHKRYWNVFEPICDEFEKRGQDLYYYTMSEDDPALYKEYTHIICEYIGSGNKAFAKMNMLNAYIVLSTTPSLDVFQWKRSKDVDYYIHIPHLPNDITTYRMFGLDFYDAVLISGEYQESQIRELERLRGIPEKEVCLVGIPYMDEMKKKLDKESNISNSRHADKNEKNVLISPSWGESGLLNRYGSKIIDEVLKTGYHIIIRPHPQSFSSEKEMLDELIDKYKTVPEVEWNRDNDNYEVLKRADIMISDFSGVIFDFALVYDKPVIYTNADFDKSPYDCAWLEEELWTFKILPHIGKELDIKHLDKIKELIDECIDNPYFDEGRKLARAETWAYIGDGTGHVVDYLLKKYELIINNRRHNVGYYKTYNN